MTVGPPPSVVPAVLAQCWSCYWSVLRVGTVVPAVRGLPAKVRSAVGGPTLGLTPPNERIEFDLVLSTAHEGDLDAFVDRVNDPGSPDYHHYVTL